MRTLFLDCSMGASGDMLMTALAELTGDAPGFVRELNALNIPRVTAELTECVRGGVRGRRISVRVNGAEEDELPSPRHGASLGDICGVIDALPVSDAVREGAKAVYGLIASAESEVHGVPVELIHMHEVGSLDAVADITGVCMLMEKLAPENIIASPVCVGSGQVKCAHGVLPVPAPATERLLRGVPVFSGEIPGEQCTPTGAALLRHFAQRFGDMPRMTVEKTGCGMGSRDNGSLNCVRAMLGETQSGREFIDTVSCNLDDATAEEIGFVTELLFEHGALDVFTVPIGMKKNRPGTLLCCMCASGDTDALCELILRHTPTLGVRVSRSERRTMSRWVESVETPLGEVRVKVSQLGDIVKRKAEYDDLAAIAKENNLTLAEVRRLAGLG